MSQLQRFGSVTVLNGHIHQIVQKVEGNITFHTARSTAYPQPAPGDGSGPGPLKVAADQLPKMLGITSVSSAPLRLRRRYSTIGSAASRHNVMMQVAHRQHAVDRARARPITSARTGLSTSTSV